MPKDSAQRSCPAPWDMGRAGTKVKHRRDPVHQARAARSPAAKIRARLVLPINRGMDKENTGDRHSGVLHGCQEEHKFVICRKMHRTGDHVVWN